MALKDWIEPAPGVNYGIIVAMQLIGCVACILLFLIQWVASGQQGDSAYLASWKDSGWWILPCPFFPAVAFYGAIWNVQRSRKTGDSTSKSKAD
mmetsp:Transcript_26945/g.52849  ORF Transcript_26945/g.52849 Transcript_26945/m.52849 type:complete len:94 (-) Transcript_26945:22-303(-)